MALHIIALFCGFTFTAITILLTRSPDPSLLMSQVTLFFLAFMFYLFQFILLYSIYYLAYCIKDVPPDAKGRKTGVVLWFTSFSLWGIAILLMFLIWNLTYLAIASGLVFAMFDVLTLVFIYKPFIERSKRLRPRS
jgi:hypothetical protein